MPRCLLFGTGVLVATLEEVAAGLSQAASGADEASAALTEARRLAVEATELISRVMHGTGSLDDEFRQVVAHWSEAADRLAELAHHLGTARTRIEQHIRSLLGETEVPWAGRARPQLPAYVTSGFYRDEDGDSDLVQSGSEPSGEDRAIARHLIDQGLARPRGSATVTQPSKPKWPGVCATTACNGPNSSSTTSSARVRSLASSCFPTYCYLVKHSSCTTRYSPMCSAEGGQDDDVHPRRLAPPR